MRRESARRIEFDRNPRSSSRGIFRAGDGPADDEITGAGLHGLLRRHDALLIIRIRPGGAHARRHELKVGTEIAAKVPVIGYLLSQILRGGNEVGDATLGRFFAIHISILPFLLTFLMVVHLLMVQVQGMSWPLSVPPEKRNRSFPFIPNFLLRDLVVWLTIFGIMLSLSVYFPTELGQKADPFLPTPTGIKPEWYFLSMFETLKFFPGYIGPIEGEVVAIGLLSLVCAGLIVIPFIDIWTKKERWSPFLVLGAVALVYMIITTAISYYGMPKL